MGGWGVEADGVLELVTAKGHFTLLADRRGVGSGGPRSRGASSRATAKLAPGAPVL